MAFVTDKAITFRKEAKGVLSKRSFSIAVWQFIALFIFWLILSRHYQIWYILIGVAAAALITFLTNDIFSSIFQHGEREKTYIRLSILKFLRFLAYMPWLLYQIAKANIQVALIVLNPRMPIDPTLLQFNSQLKREIAQVILANSITLTPGTVTISLEKGRYIVHALVTASAQSLVEAKMQNRIGNIFMEEKEQPPTVAWSHSIEELTQ
jgi:multicomponent Na+:H+ antiporter subunit E